MADFKCATLTDFMEVWFWVVGLFVCLFFQSNVFFLPRILSQRIFCTTQNCRPAKSPFRCAPDDVCESSCLGCCDFVVLQGLLSIAELGKKEGDLGASVSLPTSRN